MALKKRFLKPIIGLMISVFVFNACFTSISIADETDQSEQGNVVYASADKSRVIVSMGDSYSAGEGIESYYGSRDNSDPNFKDWLAHRSQNSWGGQLVLPEVGKMSDTRAGQHDDPHWYFVAASGALTDHMRNRFYKGYLGADGKYVYAPDPADKKTVAAYEELRQKHSEYDVDNYLDPQLAVFEELQDKGIVPDYITLTLGGNDVGFVQVLSKTAMNNDYLNPYGIQLEVGQAIEKLDKGWDGEPSVRDKLKQAYYDIDNAARIGDKQPCILVAGYPHLLNDNILNTSRTFEGVSIQANTFTTHEAEVINKSIDYFNEAIKSIVDECRRAENSLNIVFIDVRGAFNGSEANTISPMINGIVFPPRESDLIPSFIYEGGLVPSSLTTLSINFNPVSAASMHPNKKGATDGYCRCVQDKIDELEGLDNASSPVPAQSKDLIGTDIVMGNYAGEDIEWTVIDENKDSALLLSKYALETKAYNDRDERTTWEECSLRSWLNDDFYNSAFNSTEKENIQLTTVENPDSLPYGTDGGNSTEDYLFLLSVDEANRYFDSNKERRVQPTKHTIDNGIVFISGEDTYCFWWLRSPGSTENAVAYVSNRGGIDENGFAANGGYNGNHGVRPAMWVSKDVLGTVSADAIVEPASTEITVGSEIAFGSYAGEDIKWIVLECRKDGIFVLSKDILAAKPYEANRDEITWEECSLRKWLNGEFYNTAFSDNEKNHIQKTLVLNPDNPDSGADGGNDTEDYLFLLSIDEAKLYFSSDEKRRAVARDYLTDKDLYIFDGYSPWWLRSPSSDTVGKYATKNAAQVTSDGYVDGYGDWITSPRYGVRPAMWISADALKPDDKPSNPNTPANEGIKVFDSPASTTISANGYDYEFHIPMVTIAGVSTDDANREIEENITSYNSGKNAGEFSSRYAYFISEKIVSIIVYNEYVDFDDDWATTVFNIEISTGKLIKDEEVIALYGISDDEFFSQVTVLYQEYNATFTDYTYINHIDDYLEENFDHISYQYIDPFIGPDGHLCFSGDVFYVGGGGSAPYLFDLNDRNWRFFILNK